MAGERVAATTAVREDLAFEAAHTLGVTIPELERLTRGSIEMLARPRGREAQEIAARYMIARAANRKAKTRSAAATQAAATRKANREAAERKAAAARELAERRGPAGPDERVMSAYYPGTCTRCRGRFPAGTEIFYDRSRRQARHALAVCPPPTPKPAPQPRPAATTATATAARQPRARREYPAGHCQVCGEADPHLMNSSIRGPVCADCYDRVESEEW